MLYGNTITDMTMTRKENYLKTVRFERPDYIPMTFHINDACFSYYNQGELLELMSTHKLLFPNYVKPEKITLEYSNCSKKDFPYTDNFGCVWQTTMDGITGTVTKHPLADWSNFENYQAPNPNVCTGIGSIDWDKVKKQIESTPDKLHIGGLRHGHTYLQLCDIRGYQNLTYDMVDEEPKLWKLIKLVEEFNLGIIKHYIDCKVDVMSYGEDLGMQQGPMLSPCHFNTYIKPSYSRIVKPAKEAGMLIHMHSDGDIRNLVDDIIECGIDIINLQDLVNGIDWIAKKFKGKSCVDLDIDRQNITVFGTAFDIEKLIKEEVTKIGSRQGGLMMIYGLYPGVPLENVKALMDAMEKYTGYFD